MVRPNWRHDAWRVRRLLSTPQSALDEVAAAHGPICGLGAGPLRMTIIGQPSLIRELLMLPNDRFTYHTPISSFGFVVGKTTMISSDGDDHKRRRGSVQQAFSRRRLERWIPMIIDRTDAAIDQLVATSTPDTAVDLYPFGRRLLIDIVLRTLFGERLATRIDGHLDGLETTDQVGLLGSLVSIPVLAALSLWTGLLSPVAD